MLRVSVTDLGSYTELDSGGQGRVYTLDPSAPVNARLRVPWPLVYKEYEDAVLAQLDPAVLERLGAAATPHLQERAAWPLALVVDGTGQVRGFLMRQVHQEFHLQLEMLQGQRVWKIGQVQQLLNDEIILANRRIAIHDVWRLEFLRDTAETMAAMHAIGVVVGDLSPMNLLASFVSRPRCFFIDSDAMRIGPDSALPQMETASWEVPGGEPLGTPATDAYKFALLAVRLFAGDQDARDPAVLARISPALHQLAVLGLGADPAQRPAPDAWIPALDATVPYASTVLPRQPPAPPVPPPTPMPFPGAVPMPVAAPVRSPVPALRNRSMGWLVKAGVVVALLCCGVPLAFNKLTSWAQEPASGNTSSTDGGNSGTDGGYSGTTGGNGGGGASAADPVAQAAAVQQILNRAKADRLALVQSVQKISDCRDIGGALATLADVGAGRRSEESDARGLRLSGLPRGDEVSATLAEAMSHSLAADQAFIQWGQTVQSRGCTSANLHNGQRTQADDESKLATAAKGRFVELWNPIAGQYGHPTITSADL